MSDLLDDYMDWLTNVRRLSPNTLIAYRGVLSVLQDANPQWGEWTTGALEDFLRRPHRGGKPPAAATMAAERHGIRGFFAWLHTRGHIQANPALDVGAPKVRNRSPKPIPDQVWRQLWAQPMSLDDRVWLGLGFYCGLRRLELATMPPSCVDTHDEMLKGMQRKGGGFFPVEYGQLVRVQASHLPHLAPDSEQFLADVAELATARAGERFLAPWAQGHERRDVLWTNRRLQSLLRRAGLPPISCTPHALRHSCATNLLRCGVPLEIIADQLSHSSLDTTRRYLQTSGQLARWNTNGDKAER